MRMPNAERAEVDIRKLRDYCLSPVHPVGKHKAAVFRAALGFTDGHAVWLRELLLAAAVSNTAVPGKRDEFGERYQIDFEVSAGLGQATIRSAWIVRTGEDIPNLTTCYVLSR